MSSDFSHTGLEEILLRQLEEAKRQLGVKERLSLVLEMPIAIENQKPFIISGIALAPGEWKGVLYSAEEISKSEGKLVGKPVILEHGKTSRKFDHVGKVLEDSFDKTLKSLAFKAEITDSLTQEEITSGKWKAVSVKVGMNYLFEGDRVRGKDLDYDDLSLTERPACQNCFIINIENALNEGVISMSEATKEPQNPSLLQTLLAATKDKYPYKYPYKYGKEGKRGMDIEDVVADLSDRIVALEATLVELAKKYEKYEEKYKYPEKKEEQAKKEVPPEEDEEEKKKKEQEAKPCMTPEEEEEKKKKEEEAKAKAPPKDMTPEEYAKWKEEEEKKKKEQSLNVPPVTPPTPAPVAVPAKEEVAQPVPSPEAKIEEAKKESVPSPEEEKKKALEKASAGELLLEAVRMGGF